MVKKEILENILEYAKKIDGYFKNVKDYNSFENNIEKIEAIVLNYIQIGENAKKLDEDFIVNNPELKLYKVIGLRNHMTHDYKGVSMKIIYDITKKDLPILISQINKLLKIKRG
jgi:uncharacterized protein with HEPN domain